MSDTHTERTEQTESIEKKVTRRSVMAAVGSVAGSSVLAGRARGDSSAGTVTELSDQLVVEVVLQYEVDSTIEPFHIEQMQSYGIDTREKTITVITPDTETEELLTVGEPIAIGDGIGPLPRTINRGTISELPLSANSTPTNKFLPVTEPVTVPAVEIQTTTPDTVTVQVRGIRTEVLSDETVSLSLSSRGVSVAEGEERVVTPTVRVANYGRLTSRTLTPP